MIVVTYEILRFLWRFDERWEWREGLLPQGWWIYGYLEEPRIEFADPEELFRGVYFVSIEMLNSAHPDIVHLIPQGILEKVHGLRYQNVSDTLTG